ncbi:hypothetical protein C0Q70_20423 [Pomacea canaliculata]|uniref:G-protein coupled receptors family 1 profile domain-containing protein n=1 Tax=Pomacea canaliculata TaxID=400727 RepID=A0A2T7NFH2_POMCA|nr:hypothetical protein C0Q70_20423 [Pomacea canaliculata]
MFSSVVLADDRKGKAKQAQREREREIINLLLDRKLRDQPRTVLMVSIGVAELVVAGVLCPLYTDSLLRGPWRHGPVTCSVYEAIFYLQVCVCERDTKREDEEEENVCVSSLAVLVFNVERLYFLLAPSMLTGRGKGRVTVLLTSLPWAVGILLVLPLYLHGAHATTVSGGPHSTCVVHWQPHLHVLTIFVSFFAPGFLVLVTLVVVLLLYVTSVMRTHSLLAPETLQERLQRRQDWISGRRRRQRHASDASHLESDMKNRQECVLSVLLVSLVSVGLQFPFFTMLLLKLFCTDHAAPPYRKVDPPRTPLCLTPWVLPPCRPRGGVSSLTPCGPVS